jgi:hypothetical protein
MSINSNHQVSINASNNQQPTTNQIKMALTLPIQTQHCAFCNHLLLATTRTLSTLPRRAGEGKDNATILPLENTDLDLEAELEDESSHKTRHVTQHTTLLLATTIPDRRATLIRREDGIEKRLLLRCGRCRVVVGYYLDRVHWENGAEGVNAKVDGEGERPPAVYILPGAVVETEKMGVAGDEGWREWIKE